MPLDYQPPQVENVYFIEERTKLRPLSTIAKGHLKSMKAGLQDKDWKLNEFFGSIFVISLTQAEDRRKVLAKELDEIGVKDFQIFDAVDGRKDVPVEVWSKFYQNQQTDQENQAVDELHKAQAGRYLSHMHIIQKVKMAYDDALVALERAQDDNAYHHYQEEVRRYSSVLILEDDAGFGFLNPILTTISKKGAGKVLRKAISALPDDWDLLYFVCNPLEPTEKFSKNLQKVAKSSGSIAYAINHLMYNDILNHMQKIADPEVTKIKSVDTEIAELHEAHKVYCINPAIAYTQPGKSSITGITWDAWQTQPIYPVN